MKRLMNAGKSLLAVFSIWLGLSGHRALAGNVFVEDTTGTIFKYTPGGSRSSFAGGLSGPVSLAIDGQGDLFAADSSYSVIYEYTPGGTRSLSLHWCHR